MINALKQAYEVIEMHERIIALEAEVERLRPFEQMYRDEVRAGIEHGQKMMVGWLDLLMSDRIKLNFDRN